MSSKNQAGFKLIELLIVLGMEDVYGPNDGIKQIGEDINRNGTLQADYTNEAPRYTGSGSYAAAEIAAVLDHRYYRRGVRLINAQTLPGIYDTVMPANSKGFTFASENGVYVLGNYNATGISSAGSPTAYTAYQPSPSSSSDVPASVVGDAVTILSNSCRLRIRGDTRLPASPRLECLPA